MMETSSWGKTAPMATTLSTGSMLPVSAERKADSSLRDSASLLESNIFLYSLREPQRVFIGQSNQKKLRDWGGGGVAEDFKIIRKLFSRYVEIFFSFSIHNIYVLLNFSSREWEGPPIFFLWLA